MDTIKKAVRLMESEQSEDALSLLENYLPQADDEEKFAIAEFYSQWGFLQNALPILKELLEKFPDENEITIQLADIYIELEDDKAAIDILDRIEEDDPTYVQALLQLADLYQAEGLFEVAEQKLLSAKEHQEDEPIIDFALGEFFFSNGDYKRSILYYEKVLLETDELAGVSIPTRLAEAHASSGEYEIALELFKDIPNKDPDLLFKYGFTAYHAKRKDIAINAWNEVIEQDPNYHTVYYELSKAYQEQGLLEEAFSVSEQGLKLDEFNQELYFHSGVLAHQLDEDILSENMVRQAIVLDPDYKEAILFLIEILKKKEDYAEIVSLIKDVKESGANDPLYEWELAKAYNELESFSNALKHYKEAYYNLTDDNEFLKEYGYFLMEDGKVDVAIPIFKSYLENEPSDVEMEEYLNRIILSNEG